MNEMSTLDRRRPASARRGAGARRALVMAPLVALLLLLAIVTTVPVAAGGDTPDWVSGIRSVIRIDSPGGDRSTSWGYSLRVVGVLEDDRRTVVVLSGTSRTPVLDMYGGVLAMAHGRWAMQSSVSTDDGYYAVKFPPLPASRSTGAVTLHLAGDYLPPRSWTFHFTILPSVTRSAPTPEAGAAGQMNVEFSSVKFARGALSISFTETGLTYDQIFGPSSNPTDQSGGLKAQGPRRLLLRVQLLDAKGQSLRWVDTHIEPAPNGGPRVQVSEAVLRTGPSPYLIVITAPDGSSVQRRIVP